MLDLALVTTQPTEGPNGHRSQGWDWTKKEKRKGISCVPSAPLMVLNERSGRSDMMPLDLDENKLWLLMSRFYISHITSVGLSHRRTSAWCWNHICHPFMILSRWDSHSTLHRYGPYFNLVAQHPTIQYQTWVLSTHRCQGPLPRRETSPHPECLYRCYRKENDRQETIPAENASPPSGLGHISIADRGTSNANKKIRLSRLAILPSGQRLRNLPRRFETETAYRRRRPPSWCQRCAPSHRG